MTAPSERRNLNYYETLSSSQSAEETVPMQVETQTPQFAKKDRKKLKKLRKRAALVLVESERSGLLTRAERDEYEALIQLEKEDDQRRNDDRKSPDSSSTKPLLPSAYPSINVRKKCSGIEKVEGSTHRDLLSWLLQQKFDRPQQQPSRKRCRDGEGKNNNNNEDVSITVPHWASVHNPGTCEQVAVLEIHLPYDKIDSYCRFLESCRTKNEIRDTEGNHAIEGESTEIYFPNSQIGVATKWFQGHMPKSMTDTLLYFSNAKKENKTKKAEDESSFPSRNDFIKRLETMLLSPEEMKEQGYPNEVPSSVEKETGGVDNSEAKKVVSRSETLQSPDSLSLERAKAYVSAFGVRVEHQKEEDKIPYISTLPDTDRESNGDIPCNEECPPRVFAVDCEMVLTTVGSELARVTLLEFDEFVGPKATSKTSALLDCLVVPDNDIVDYLTKHSGITPGLLEPVGTRLQQVQCALCSFLRPNDILIGHSLENDLRALHYIHPRIVDTSMIFRPSDQNKRFKFSLRHLSGTLLKKPIQKGSHCSEEDAQTALDLALLKALKGDDLQVPGFGDNQRKSLLRQPFAKQSVAAFIGPNHWLETHITRHPNGAHALNYDSPKDCKKAMLAWMTNKRKAELIWSKIELGTEASSSSSSESSLEIFRSLVTEIVEKLPPACVLMVAIQGELQKAKNMFKRRGACRDPRSSVIWTDNDEETWKNLLNSTRVGYVQWFSAPINKKS